MTKDYTSREYSAVSALTPIKCCGAMAACSCNRKHRNMYKLGERSATEVYKSNSSFVFSDFAKVCKYSKISYRDVPEDVKS